MSKIIGIGSDLVKISRMELILSKSYGTRFLNKTLHEEEIKHLQQKSDILQKAIYLASRWAVKESTVKASGLRELIFPMMNVVSKQNGQPTLQYLGQNKILMDQIKVKQTFVTITHEEEYAQAFVLLVGGDE